jgi:hypothetical protein
MALDADKVHRTIRKLRKLLADPEARPSADHVHDLRTRTRRLESAMEALGLDGGRLTRICAGSASAPGRCATWTCSRGTRSR